MSSALTAGETIGWWCNDFPARRAMMIGQNVARGRGGRAGGSGNGSRVSKSQAVSRAGLSGVNLGN